MFREFLVYHSSSLEFRAMLITLMIASDNEINECEEKTLREAADKTYKDDEERAELLVDTVKEYYEKIKTNNGLNFNHLIILVQREIRENKRFSEKIDIKILKSFSVCLGNEDDRIFNQHIIEFLEELKQEYGAV
jgi:lysyl-tRNA synthetase class I